MRERCGSACESMYMCVPGHQGEAWWERVPQTLMVSFKIYIHIYIFHLLHGCRKTHKIGGVCVDVSPSVEAERVEDHAWWCAPSAKQSTRECVWVCVPRLRERRKEGHGPSF